MCQHQSADRSMGAHGTTLRYLNAHLVEMQNFVEVKDGTLVGEGRIAYGRADADEFLLKEFVHGQLLVFRIAPIGLSDFFVHLFGGGFCKSVRQSLYQ